MAEAATVNATVTDDRAVNSVLLKYNAGAGFQDVTMFDDGNHGDGVPGDDVYGGFIPPRWMKRPSITISRPMTILPQS